VRAGERISGGSEINENNEKDQGHQGLYNIIVIT
jgi:hypothetical protein